MPFLAIFWRALLLTEMQNIAKNGKKVIEVLYRVIMCTHLLPFLSTIVIRQIVAIFGNLVKQNIARNGKKVTEVLYE